MSQPAMIDLHVTDDRKPLCDRHALAIFWGAGMSTNVRLLLKLLLFWFLNIDFNWATAGLHDRCAIVALEVSMNVPYN